MKRIILLFALCGLLWPSVGHSQTPATPRTEPNLRLRYAPDDTGSNLDTLFVDWSTVYAKPEDPTSELATGTPATSYYVALSTLEDDSSYLVFFSLAPPAGEYEGGRSYDAHVRRDTLVAELTYGDKYYASILASFPDGSTSHSGFLLPPVRVGAIAALSVNPTFVREDAGATTIEVKAQLPEDGDRYWSGDFYVTPTLPLHDAFGLNGAFYFDAPTFVFKESENSATGQMTLTPIPPNLATVFYDELGITIGVLGGEFLFQPTYIRLLDSDRPTTEIELTVSDPVISIDGRATDVTVTGTLSGALLDEAVSFQLGVMPPTTAARDTDFDIRLARLTIPAGQATGTATVRVTPRNQNDGQIWLGAASHPTIGTGSNQRTIVVKEAAIELTKQPSGLIAYIEKIIPGGVIREDAGQVNVDLKVSLKDASPVDETVRFEIKGDLCYPEFSSLYDVARRGTDYFAELSPLTIPAGQKEATGTLSLEIANNSNTNKTREICIEATLGNSRYSEWLRIEDDETATSFVGLSVSPTEIAEDSGQTTITVTGTLSGSVLSESLTIPLRATEERLFIGDREDVSRRDSDYTADFEQLTIPAGQVTGTAAVTITPTPNDGQEQDESIFITAVNRTVKITEDGQEREIRIGFIEITLKDVADQPASATQTGETPSSLAFDAPASTVIPGTVGQMLSEVLPTATSDPEGALTYRVFNLPDGLTFDPATRTISGTPTTAGQTAIEYYALSEGVSAVLTYTIDIQEKPKVIVELDDIAAAPLSMGEDAGETVDITLTITLRKAAKGDVVVGLAIVSPIVGKTAKLNEDFTATLPATVTIPAGQRKGAAQMSVQPKDNTTADGNKAFAVEATSPSGHQALANIQIIDDETASPTASADYDSSTPDSDEDGGQAEDSGEDSEDTFAFASVVDDQAYTEGTEITALVLPEATGGEGAITYRVFDLPAGLAFDATTRTISGTPTATDGAVEVAYLAQDSAGVGITLTFSITVNPALSFDELGTGGG